MEGATDVYPLDLSLLKRTTNKNLYILWHRYALAYVWN